MAAVHHGKVVLSAIVMVQITPSARKHLRVQGCWAVLVLLKQQIYFLSRYVVEVWI